MLSEALKAKVKVLSQEERKELAAFLAVALRVDDSDYLARLSANMEQRSRLPDETATEFVARHERTISGGSEMATFPSP